MIHMNILGKDFSDCLTRFFLFSFFLDCLGES